MLALFTQDLDATRGLAKSGSAAYCRGGMFRSGDPRIGRTINWPYIECRISVDEDLNAKNGDVFVCTVEMRIHGNRDQNYGGNSGDIALNTVAQRVREVYNDCPVAKGGSGDVYRISSFKRQQGTLGEVGDKDLVLVDRYTVLVSSKDQNVFQVYNSASKRFYRGGFSSEGRRYVVTDIPDLESPNNDIPHVGWTDRQQIVRSTERLRVFNRFDAEYMVNYEPLDFSFNEQQRRVEIATGLVEQAVPLYKRVSQPGPDGNYVWYLPQELKFKRATYTRTEQVKKDLGKNLEQDVLLPLMNAISADTNKVRLYGTTPYLFLGADVEYNTNSGIAIVTAKFWTVGPVKAIPANSGQGVVYDVGVPALGYLEDYVVTEPIPASNGPGTSLPAIGVKPYADLYDVGGFQWL